MVEPAPDFAPMAAIAQRIQIVRGHKVLLDSDLALLYGVETRRLNEQVRRNAGRFPADFMLELTQFEFDSLMSQIAISKQGRGGRRKLPLAFTEHGALMAATVMNSPHAVKVSLYVVRAFVQMREFLLSHQDLARKLTELERRVEELAFDHSKQTRSTRVQLQQAFEAIRELMALPPEPRRRPIGFVVPEDNPSGKARATQLPRRKVEDRPASTVRTRWMKKPPSTKN